MNLSKIARCWLLKRELNRALAARRIARERRSEAARKGHSNELRRRAAKCRETFA